MRRGVIGIAMFVGGCVVPGALGSTPQDEASGGVGATDGTGGTGGQPGTETTGEPDPGTTSSDTTPGSTSIDTGDTQTGTTGADTGATGFASCMLGEAVKFADGHYPVAAPNGTGYGVLHRVCTSCDNDVTWEFIRIDAGGAPVAEPVAFDPSDVSVALSYSSIGYPGFMRLFPRADGYRVVVTQSFLPLGQLEPLSVMWRLDTDGHVVGDGAVLASEFAGYHGYQLAVADLDDGVAIVWSDGSGELRLHLATFDDDGAPVIGDTLIDPAPGTDVYSISATSDSIAILGAQGFDYLYGVVDFDGQLLSEPISITTNQLNLPIWSSFNNPRVVSTDDRTMMLYSAADDPRPPLAVGFDASGAQIYQTELADPGLPLYGNLVSTPDESAFVWWEFVDSRLMFTRVSAAGEALQDPITVADPFYGGGGRSQEPMLFADDTGYAVMWGDIANDDAPGELFFAHIDCE